MSPPNDDMLAARLAELLSVLPDESLDPRVADVVRQRARAALEAGPRARFARLFAGVLLPAVLVGCAVVYAIDAAVVLERTYVATR